LILAHTRAIKKLLEETSSERRREDLRRALKKID
jgi:hypothetical protein